MILDISNWSYFEWLFAGFFILAFVYIIVRVVTHAYYKSKHEYLSNLKKLVYNAQHRNINGGDDEKQT